MPRLRLPVWLPNNVSPNRTTDDRVLFGQTSHSYWTHERSLEGSQGQTNQCRSIHEITEFTLDWSIIDTNKDTQWVSSVTMEPAYDMRHISLWILYFISNRHLPSGIGFLPRKKSKTIFVMLYNGSIPLGFVMAVLLYLTFSFHTEKLASRNWMMPALPVSVCAVDTWASVDVLISTTIISTACNGVILRNFIVIFASMIKINVRYSLSPF